MRAHVRYEVRLLVEGGGTLRTPVTPFVSVHLAVFREVGSHQESALTMFALVLFLVVVAANMLHDCGLVGGAELTVFALVEIGVGGTSLDNVYIAGYLHASWYTHTHSRVIQDSDTT